MNYLWTTISVSDIEKAEAFFTEFAGLSVTQKFSPAPEVEITFLGMKKEGETVVELIKDKSAPAFAGSGISLGFEVDSAEKWMEKCKKGGIKILSDIIETPMFKFFAVEGPEKVKIQFAYKKPQN